MESKSRKKKAASGKKVESSKARGQNNKTYTAKEKALYHEVGLIVLFALAVILFLCNFGLIGTFGDGVSTVMFGVFGWTAYIAPVAVFLGALFWFANRGSRAAIIKLISGILLFFMAGVVLEFIGGKATTLERCDFIALYEYCSAQKKGGGVLAGSLAYFMYSFLDLVGSLLVVIVISIIAVVLLTERSFVSSVKRGGQRVVEKSRQDSARRRENAEQRRAQQDELREKRQEEKRLRMEEKENEKHCTRWCQSFLF